MAVMELFATAASDARGFGGATPEFWETWCVMVATMVLKMVATRFLLLFVSNQKSHVMSACLHAMETEPYFIACTFCWARFSTPPAFGETLLQAYTISRILSWSMTVWLTASAAAPLKIINSAAGEGLLIFVALSTLLSHREAAWKFLLVDPTHVSKFVQRIIASGRGEL